MTSRNLTITLPVLNERKHLDTSVRRILDTCGSHAMDAIDICIADNGSTDGTETIGRELAEQFAAVSYLRDAQVGFGRALKMAWPQTRTGWVGYMDLDLATDLKHLVEVYGLIQQGTEHDLIVGSRLLPGSRVMGRTPFREVSSRAFNTLLRTTLGVGFSDAMCGFKFIRAERYDRLASAFRFTDGWFFVTELVVRAEWMGFSILELPVHWTDDPDSASSSRFVRLTKQYLQGIAQLKRERNAMRRP